jgi:hypothetical protein
VQPLRPWLRILNNQRGFVLDRAIQQGTSNVVICRLRFRLTAWSGSTQTDAARPAATAQPDAVTQPQGPAQPSAPDDGG